MIVVRSLCFINIAGGAASDSSNTLWRLERVQDKNPIYAVFTLKKDKYRAA